MPEPLRLRQLLERLRDRDDLEALENAQGEAGDER